jgi:hypothetical protein
VIRWPIKATFRSYVERLSDGAVAARDGATVEQDSTSFMVPEPSHEELFSSATFHTEGEVRFGGHGGLLVVPFRAPGVHVDAEGRHVLSIEYPWASTTPEPRLEIAVVEWGDWLEEDDGSKELRSTSVALTADGAELFNDMYPQGSELDPLTVRVQGGA